MNMTIKEQRDAVLGLLRNEFKVNTTTHADGIVRITGAGGLDELLRIVANNLVQAFEVREQGDE